MRDKSRTCVYDCAWFSMEIQKLTGHGALNKKLPPFSLDGPVEHLLGLLDGLLSTDGSVSVSNAKNKPQLMVNYSTSSIDLVNGVQALLSRLGVTSSFNKYISQASGRDAFIITISTIGLKKLHQKYGFSLSHSSKNETFQRMIGEINDKFQGVSIIPVPTYIFPLLNDIFKNHLNKDNQKRKTSQGTAYVGSIPIWQTYGYVSQRALLPYIPFLKDRFASSAKVAQFIEMVEREDIVWEKVKEVQALEGKQVGYDITVPGPFTFATATGVFVQDSMNFHVPVSDAAVKEIKEKMMPSTNLLSIKQNKAHYQPSQEFVLGMYKASTPNTKKKTVVFGSNEEAEAAYKSGMIDIDTPILVSSSAAGLLSGPATKQPLA